MTTLFGGAMGRMLTSTTGQGSVKDTGVSMKKDKQIGLGGSVSLHDWLLRTLVHQKRRKGVFFTHMASSIVFFKRGFPPPPPISIALWGYHVITKKKHVIEAFTQNAIHRIILSTIIDAIWDYVLQV